MILNPNTLMTDKIWTPGMLCDETTPEGTLVRCGDHLGDWGPPEDKGPLHRLFPGGFGRYLNGNKGLRWRYAVVVDEHGNFPADVLAREIRRVNGDPEPVAEATYKLHDPSRALGPDNPPPGYRLAEVGEKKTEGYIWWDEDLEELNWNPGCPEYIGETVLSEDRIAALVDTAKSFGPLYAAILDQIDAHDSATRCERADRVYAEAMRAIGGGV